MYHFFTEWIIFHHNYLFLAAAIILLGCAFVLAKRLISWGLKKGRGYLLSFIVGSLFYLNLFFFILVIGNEEAQAVIFLPYLLQVISLYGFILLILIGIKIIYNRLLHKKT